MKTSIVAAMAFTVTLAAHAPTALAQDQAASADTQPNVKRLLEDVNAIAAGLEKNIADVMNSLTVAIKSREDGAKLLDQMQASIEAVHGSLAEDSNIWTELKRAMDIWDENRKKALEKSETNPAFDEIAQQWSVKIGQANVLRKQILTQRAESMATLDQIVANREVVLAHYDLGQADKALEAMQTVSDNLGRMNDQMRTIVDQTQVVAGPAIPQ